MKSCAVIGAGLSGLTLARILSKHFEVTLYEKSNGPGGRMASRQVSPYSFDHGAQYFTAKTEPFKQYVNQLIKVGCIERWDARFVEIEKKEISNSWQWSNQYPHYVGVPTMNAIGKHLGNQLNIKLNVNIQSLNKTSDSWHLYDNQGNLVGSFDWVIIAIPAAQAVKLLPASISFSTIIKTIKMTGCFSLMLGFQKTYDIKFDAALIRGRDISWVSVNSSKPQRNQPFSLLVHSTNSWADKNINERKNYIIEHMCKEVNETLGFDVTIANHQDLHTWRFANAKKRYEEKYLIDKEKCIAVCGDWLIQGNVEAAFTSGNELANQIWKSSLI